MGADLPNSAGVQTPGKDRYRQELSREISPAHNVLITLSGITPASSVFIIVPAVIATVGTGSILAMIFAALVCALMAFCWAELGAAYPIAGGDYPLVYHAFNGRFGALSRPLSFMLFVLLSTTTLLGTAVISLGIVDYIPMGRALDPRALATVLIVLATIIAVLRIRVNAVVTGVFLIIELLALSSLVILALTHFHARFGEVFFNWVRGGVHGGLTAVPFAKIATATPIAIYAYNGFNSAVWFSEETRGPSRGIAAAVLWSLAIAVATELIPTASVIFGAPDLATITTSPAPLTDFILATSGKALNNIVSIGIALAVFNAIIACILGEARMLYAAGRDHAFPGRLNGWMAAIHPRFQSPWVATLTMGLLVVLLCLTVSEAALIKATGTALVFSYSFIAVSALVGRASGATDHGLYKMPLWPAPPALALAALIYIATKQPADLLLITVGELAVGFLWWAIVVRPQGDNAWRLKQPNIDTASE